MSIVGPLYFCMGIQALETLRHGGFRTLYGIRNGMGAGDEGVDLSNLLNRVVHTKLFMGIKGPESLKSRPPFVPSYFHHTFCLALGSQYSILNARKNSCV
jgi:hypothetical protein